VRISLEPIASKRRLLDPAIFKAEIERATLEVKNGIQDDFKKTTATWRHRVVWYTTRRGTDWFIGTKDEIYGYVDLGTRAHVIRPKRPGGSLRFFRTGFKAKSRVGYIASYAGQQATKDLTYTKEVHHPGTKARNFTVKIGEKWRSKWVGALRRAIHTAAGGK